MKRGVVGAGAVVLVIAFAACGGRTAEQGNPGNGSGAAAGLGGATMNGGAAGAPGDGSANGGTAGTIGGFAGRGGTAGVGGISCGSDFVLPLRTVDVVLAVDTSSTMHAEVAALESGLNRFFDIMLASGGDPHLVVLASHRGGPEPGLCAPSPLGSGSCAQQGSDTKLPRYFHHPTATVGSDDALNVLISTFPEYRDHLRLGAAKTVLIVSDGDATAPPYGSADAFIPAFSALDPELLEGWSLSAFYAFDPCPDTRTAGSVYNEIAIQRVGASSGGNLCFVSADQLLVTLADHLVDVTPAACAWDLPNPADRPPTGNLQVDRSKYNLLLNAGRSPPEIIRQVADPAECDAALGGWHHVGPKEQKRIGLCEATCERVQNRETRITLLFGCY